MNPVHSPSSCYFNIHFNRRPPGYSTSPRQRAAGPHHLHVVYQQGATVLHFNVFVRLFRTAAEANSHVALFWSMTMHAHIPPGWHRPCCVMNSIGTHSTILHTVWTWHHWTFTSSWRWRSTLLVNDMQMMRTCSTLSWTGWIAEKPVTLIERKHHSSSWFLFPALS